MFAPRCWALTWESQRRVAARPWPTNMTQRLKRGARTTAPRSFFQRRNCQPALPILQIHRVDFFDAAISQDKDSIIGCETEPEAPRKYRTDNVGVCSLGNKFYRPFGYARSVNIEAMHELHAFHEIHIAAVVRPGLPAHETSFRRFRRRQLPPGATLKAVQEQLCHVCRLRHQELPVGRPSGTEKTVGSGNSL